MAIGRATALALFGPPVFLVGDAREAVSSRQRADDDAAAIAAVAAVGAALRDVFLPPEAAHPAAAMSARNKQSYAIDKHGVILSSRLRVCPNSLVLPAYRWLNDTSTPPGGS